MRVIALTLLLFGLLAAPATAQTFEANQKAVVVFDIRMDMLNSSELGKQMKFAENLTAMNAQSGVDGPDPGKLVRIFGAMSAPKNMDELMALQGGGAALPFEFFARAKYKDAETAKQSLELSLDGSEEKIEKGGRTFYKTAEGAQTPPGLFMHMVDETTVEIGTETYVMHKDRDVFTDSLKASWAKAPNEAIRLAIDVNGAKDLVAQLVEQGKASSPPPSHAFFDLINNVKDMGISIDLSSKNLLTLRANALDSEKAEELKGGLDSLLFMGKTAGQGGLAQLKGAPGGEEVAGVLGKILDSMKAKQSGTDITVMLPRPEGFESAVQKGIGLVGGMMMGGMGGGGMSPPPLRPPSEGR